MAVTHHAALAAVVAGAAHFGDLVVPGAVASVASFGIAAGIAKAAVEKVARDEGTCPDALLHEVLASVEFCPSIHSIRVLRVAIGLDAPRALLQGLDVEKIGRFAFRKVLQQIPFVDSLSRSTGALGAVLDALLVITELEQAARQVAARMRARAATPELVTQDDRQDVQPWTEGQATGAAA